MATLTSQQLKDSYQSLVTIGDSITSNPTSGRLENGKGTPLTAVGINTDAPGNKIGIKTAVNTNERAINLYSGTTVAGNYVSIGSQYSETNANVNSEIRFGGENTGGAPSYLAFATGTSTSSTERLRIKSSGDISFRDGSANEAFYWDASAGSLGLGTTTPNSKLTISGGTNAASEIRLINTAPATDNDWFITPFYNDQSLRFRTNGAATTVLTMLDSGNVGIGTNNPSYKTEIDGGSSEVRLRVSTTGTDANEAGIILANSSKTSFNDGIEISHGAGKTQFNGLTGRQYYEINAASGESADHHKWYTNNTERMRIDSSGNVGIGTTSPNSYTGYTALTLNNATNGGIIDIERNGTLIGEIFTDDANTFTLQAVGSRSVNFRTANQERMRIDSSGNLMVGTDNLTWQSVAGLRYFNGSSLNVTRDGNEPLNLNRLTSDGDIAIFRKDSTAVGSIGSTSGVVSHIILDPRSSAKGAGIMGASIDANTGIIQPTDRAGAVADNAINLGSTSNRWKDLYLGGSVYLGGTTSANALNDYEEGTFTPVVAGTWTTAPTSLTGKYTKIGNVVHVQITFSGGAKASATAGYLEDLPFTASHGTGQVMDSGVNDKGGVLFANTDRIWFAQNSFAVGSNRVTGTYLIN